MIRQQVHDHSSSRSHVRRWAGAQERVRECRIARNRAPQQVPAPGLAPVLPPPRECSVHHIQALVQLLRLVTALRQARAQRLVEALLPEG